VLALFVEASAHHTTPVLETVFSHLGEIEVPGTTTEIATLDFSELQEKVNEMRFLCVVRSLSGVCAETDRARCGHAAST
jgi:hypothetical protein